MENSAGYRKWSSFFLKPFRILWIIAGIIILAGAGSCFFKVDETELAVITRFGKYYATLGPGLQFKLPFGIDRSFKVPVKVVQTEQFGFKTLQSGVKSTYQNHITDESTMLTGDLNIVDVEWIIQYRIVDPRAWLFNVQEKQQTIRDISRAVINTQVGDRAILDIMGQDRTTIEDSALDMMNQDFKQLGLGIHIITVRLQNIVPPKGVQDAFEDVNKAIQDMNRFINEGKEAYNAAIPKTQGEADQQIQIAEGYAAERVNRAKGDVARFNSVLNEYRRAPKVTQERLYLETMNELFSSDNKPTLIDGELKNVLPVKTLTGSGSVKQTVKTIDTTGGNK